MIRRCLRWLVAPALVLAGCGQDFEPTDLALSCYQLDEKMKEDQISKVDLLIVLDNSPQMADKQQFIRQGVVDFVHRLTSPPCMRSDGTTDFIPADPYTACPAGAWRENRAIFDLHVGVITSSLADPFGGCPADALRGDGRLIAPNRAATYGGLGFLSWDLFQEQSPPGERDVAALETALGEILDFAARPGCQFPAPLEAAYRFLVDPSPYVGFAVDDAGHARPVGVDQMLLFERESFLRPGSKVTVAIFSDGNDCSVRLGERILARDAGGSPQHPARGTSICLTKPDDLCCFPCGGAPPAGCAPSDLDVECLKGPFSDAEDPYALRCFHQKQRFGADSLYPVQRYIDGFLGAKVPGRDGRLVDNPILTDLRGNGPSRDPYLVSVLGVVGVPWQDLAKDPANLAEGFRPSFVIDESLLIGEPATNAPPSEPLMIESIEPRAGTGIAPPNSGPIANPVNGHEHQPMADLQYACVFTLPASIACAPGAACACADSTTTMDPICQNPVTGQYGDVQFRSAARPGVRQIETLLGLGEQGMITSICPGNLAGSTSATDHGYRPALSGDTVFPRFYSTLRGRCLPRKLPVQTCADATDPRDGQVSCTVIEGRAIDPGRTCNCDLPGRRDPDPADIREEMRTGSWCLCEITQLSGAAAEACRADLSDIIAPAGWCYVDPAQGLGSPELVADCGATEKERLRFVGGPQPIAPVSAVWVRCGYCADRDAPADGGTGGCQQRMAY